jgi:DNA polymerase III epsilon subunit-like protein
MEGFLTLLDFETTGKNPKRDRVTEIGLIALDENWNEVGKYESLINPSMEISAGASAVSDIYQADVASAHSFRNYWPDVFPFFHNRVVISHNARFDLAFLEHELSLMNINKVPKSVCSLQMAFRNLKGITPNQTLGGLCEYFGIELDAHKALNDARAAGKLLRIMLDKFPNENSLLDEARQNIVSFEQPPQLAARPLIRSPRRVRINPKIPTKTEIPRELSDSQIENLAHDIYRSGKVQVCLTGLPSMGLENFKTALLKVGLKYEVGPIRKTKSAFLVVGVEEEGQTKVFDARQHRIPIFNDSDFNYLLRILSNSKL